MTLSNSTAQEHAGIHLTEKAAGALRAVLKDHLDMSVRLRIAGFG